MPRKKSTEKKDNVLRLKKSTLPALALWLNKLSLSGFYSRSRTRFVKDIGKVLRELEQERTEIVGRYVVKEDKDGKQVWKQTVDNGQQVWEIQDDKAEEFSKEVKELFEEEYVVEVNEENRQKISCIRDILLNSAYEFGPKAGEQNPQVIQEKIKEANAYDEWCEAFEALKL